MLGRPRIGISWGAGADATTGVPFDTPVAYVEAIERAGGEPVLLTNDVALLGAQVAPLHGVLLSGGQDVAPERYGGRRGATVQPADLDRDTFEIALLEHVRRIGLPLLGICRGLQIANVAFGGTLIEDISMTFGERALDHVQRAAAVRGCYDVVSQHVVTVEPDTKLATLACAERFPTNSLHHQAAGEIGTDLRETAMTPDGIVEALEATFAHPFFLAVQWHPELIPEDMISQRLFGSFAAAARTRCE